MVCRITILEYMANAYVADMKKSFLVKEIISITLIELIQSGLLVLCLSDPLPVEAAHTFIHTNQE